MAGSGLAPLIGIVEVAALAGVSPATVSRALRGLPGVSAATRANVEQAAAALGYVAAGFGRHRRAVARVDGMPDPDLAPLVGILEVAARAGVSPATVSRALRGYSGVSAPTRGKVERAAAALGYVASPSAAALTTGRTNAVGVMAPWSSRWFVGAVVEGAQEVLADRGYHTILAPMGIGTASDRPFVIDTSAVLKRVDGVIALDVPNSIQPSSFRDLRVPLVTIGTSIPGISGVVVDDLEVGRLATCHLLEMGHRRIAFIGRNVDGRLGFPVADQRVAGYLGALTEYSLDVDPWLVRTAGFTVEAGNLALGELWREAAGDSARLPTAIFAVTDEVAMGALHFARNHSIRVPEQLSVIGAENHDLAYLFELTTVGRSAREQGRLAAQMLLDRLQRGSPPAPSEVARLDPYLIERGTVVRRVASLTATQSSRPHVNIRSFL